MRKFHTYILPILLFFFFFCHYSLYLLTLLIQILIHHCNYSIKNMYILVYTDSSKTEVDTDSVVYMTSGQSIRAIAGHQRKGQSIQLDNEVESKELSSWEVNRLLQKEALGTVLGTHKLLRSGTYQKESDLLPKKCSAKNNFMDLILGDIETFQTDMLQAEFRDKIRIK